MHWRAKALGFRALAFPGAASAHYFLQRHVTRTWPRPPAALDALAGKARRVVHEFVQFNGQSPRSALEVGAGRDLATAIGLRAAGVHRVIATDLHRIAKLDLVGAAARSLLGREITAWEELEAVGVYYRAPHLPDASDGLVDCSCSNEVLEHVPAADLPALLTTLRRVTTGLTVHSIDYSDHYARVDRSISRLNFLSFSDAEWRQFNSSWQYVNRLRHGDYLRLFEEAGFRILSESSIKIERPYGLRVAEQFQRYSDDDLLATSGIIIAS